MKSSLSPLYAAAWLASIGVGFSQPSPTLRITAPGASEPLPESLPDAQVTVRREGDLSGLVTVDYQTEDGTARAGQDYAATAGTLRFGPGDAVRIIAIPLVNDGLREGIETFRLRLSNPTGGAVLPAATGTITLQDNDPGVHFAPPANEVVEGRPWVRVPVLAGSDSLSGFTVNFATADGTAKAGEDYVQTMGRLEFAPGERIQYVTVPLLNDAVQEPNESFRLTLSGPTGGVSLGSPATITVTIKDNDAGIRFESADYQVDEPSGAASVTVARGSDTDTPFSVDYATEDGTAVAGEDYQAVSGTLDFATGQPMQAMVVPILNDARKEASETIRVKLANPTGGAQIAQATATITIRDNDLGLRFATNQFQVGEAAGTLTIVLRRDTDADAPCSVDYATQDGSAFAGQDYEAALGTLNFAGGDREKTFTVAILNDGVTEPGETFLVRLSNPTGSGALGTPTQATVRIQDNDAGAGFTSAWVFVAENAGTAQLTVRLDNDGATPGFTVDYATRDGSALAGEDYGAAAGQLDFAPGETEKTITIPILDDAQAEFEELFEVILHNPSGGPTLGACTTAKVGIANRGGPQEAPVVGPLHARLDRGYPRLEWPNVAEQAFELEVAECLEGLWNPLAVVTGDSATLTWADETDRPATRFYRLAALTGESLPVKLQTTLDRMRRQTGTPGVSAALASKQWGLWTGTGGKAHTGANAPPIRPQTRFSIASVTKNFTSALILQLRDEGKLSLDDPLSQWLPELVDERRIVGRITIRQLLNHTSGIHNYLDGTGFWDEIISDPTSRSRRAELASFIGEPNFAPGTGWAYSNSNFVLLGLIIEKATGNTAIAEFRKRFFGPLKLGGMFLSEEEMPSGECAVGYNFADGEWLNMKVMQGEPAGVRVATLAYGFTSHGLHATAENLARWSQALFGGAVLSEASLRAMTSESQNTVWSGMLGNPEGYGLGCGIFHTRWGHLLGISGGNTAGHLTRMLYSPEREFALTVMVNEVSSVGAEFTKIDAITGALLDLVLQKIQDEAAPKP